MPSVARPAFLKSETPIAFTAHAAPDHRVQGFHSKKQITFDHCWAAVAVSTARFRGIGGVPRRAEMVDAYPNSNLQGCPCCTRPGDNGLLLWCVDCACQLISTRCKALGSLPAFDALCNGPRCAEPGARPRRLQHRRPLCRHGRRLVSASGAKMVTIADPDRANPICAIPRTANSNT